MRRRASASARCRSRKVISRRDALPLVRERGGVTVATLALAFLAACSAPVPDSAAHVAGDPIRGHTIVVSRDGGFCVLCHAVPGERQAGDIGPSLAGVGSRLTPQEIRARV